MDYKEKYEQALERAKNIRFGNPQSATANTVCEEIFPELKESEDERIRKAILALVTQSTHILSPMNQKSMFDWLEKQGEHKPTDKVEPKFKVGDWIVRDYDNSYATNRVIKVEQIDDETFGYTLDNETYFSGYWENSYRLWTIQDAKDGDVLAIDLKDERHWQKIVIFKSLNEIGVEGYGNTFANNELALKENVPFYSKTWTKYLYPATKEQRELLFSKMKEAGYEWDDENKELKKIGQIFPTWSEEDEKILDSIIEDVMPIGECPDYPTDEEREYYYEGDRKVEWLKSIKERIKGE